MSSLRAGGQQRDVRAATSRRFAERGFTLVELMMVIVVIGLAVAAVAWALPDPRGRLADEAARFAGRARAARDLAITGGRPVSVWVSAGGYGFDERRAGSWVAAADGPLKVARWNDGTLAGMTSQGQRERTTFDPTGLVDHPLMLRLSRGAVSTSVAIGADGRVKVGG